MRGSVGFEKFPRTLKGEGHLYSDKDICLHLIGKRRCSIIIPSFEVLECLKAAVLAIETYTDRDNYELIIVDNNSSKDVQDYLLSLQDQGRAVVVLNESNTGYSFAVNQGIQLAEKDSDLILFNNDAIVTSGWLNALYEAKDLNPNAGLIMPSQILPGGSGSQKSHVPFCDKGYEVDVNLSFHHQNIGQVKTVNGNKQFVNITFAAFFCVMITRDCFNQLGLLDHVNGRHYKSDRLYCKLARKEGVEIIYTPYAKVYHLLQQATKALKKSDKEQYDVMFVKNKWDSSIPKLSK